MPPRFDKLLVLDLDETLVYATKNAEEVARVADYSVGPYQVYRRPGVRPFLERCLQLFQVGVWTASTLDYARPTLRPLVDLDLLVFIWGRERCTLRCDPETREYERLKDIRKLRRQGYAKENILFVDDTPAKLARSYGNHIGVRAYFREPEDDELDLLAEYLERLGPEPDVRRVEKRGWRDRVVRTAKV